MPNIKSAKKRVLVNAKKAEQNKAIRSAVRTEIKKIDLLIKENKYEEAKAALSNAFSVIDSACSKNILHANNAANKKAKLAKKIDAIAVSTPVEEVAPVVEEAPVAEVEEVKPAKKATKKAETAEGEEPKKATRKPRAKKTEAAE
jgi:small subunit ribosomal protein S20